MKKARLSTTYVEESRAVSSCKGRALEDRRETALHGLDDAQRGVRAQENADYQCAGDRHNHGGGPKVELRSVQGGCVRVGLVAEHTMEYGDRAGHTGGAAEYDLRVGGMSCHERAPGAYVMTR